MSRQVLVSVFLSFVLAVSWFSGARGESTPDENLQWSIKAAYTDACCCKPSCPCFFGSPPTLGFCEGITFLDIEQAHYGDVRLDGIKVVAVYRGGTWIKFYVDEGASAEQTDAVLTLLPTFEKFFAIDNVLEVKNVPISVERGDGTIKVTTASTVAELEVMKGKNGNPIKIQNLPGPDFPAPPLNDHTQYRTVVLKHQGKDHQFEHSGTNGLTAKIEVASTTAH